MMPVRIAASVVMLLASVSATSGVEETLPLPDFRYSTPAVVTQVTEAHEAAVADDGPADAFGRLAMALHANAFHDEARAAYQRAMQRQPEEFRWPYLLAVLEIAKGRNAEALRLLERAVELRQDYAPAWTRLGQMRGSTGQRQAAKAAYERALKLEPGHPHATAELALMLGEEGRWDEAVPLLIAAAERYPHVSTVHRLLVNAYSALGQEELIEWHEGRGAEIQIDDDLLFDLFSQSTTGPILTVHASMAKDWGRLDLAEQLMRRAARVAPNDRDVLIVAASFLSTTPGVASPATVLEAEDLLKRALKLDPTFIKTRHEYANLLYTTGRYDEARRQWLRIVEEEPQHAWALMSLGQLALRERDFAQARDWYERGLAVPLDTMFTLGDPVQGHYYLALCHWAVGDTNKALAAFETAARANARLTSLPSQVRRVNDHARLLRQLNRPEEAERVITDAIAEWPYDHELYFAYGNFLLGTQRFAEARTQLEKMLEIEPQHERALAALGYVEYQLGDLEDARRHLRLALAIEPTLAIAHFHLGNVLAREGRTTEAIDSYEKCLQYRPGFQPAQQALRQVRGY
jgi:superkiller protein 3